LQSRFLDKEQTYVRETGALTVNGILLYDLKDIDQVYKKTLEDKQETICQAIAQQVLSDLGVIPF